MFLATLVWTHVEEAWEKMGGGGDFLRAQRLPGLSMGGWGSQKPG